MQPDQIQRGHRAEPVAPSHPNNGAGEGLSNNPSSGGSTGRQPATIEEAAPEFVSRSPVKMGWGIAVALLAAIFMLAAFVFVWFGFFPGLVALLLALPLSLLAVRLIRRGRPIDTA